MSARAPALAPAARWFVPALLGIVAFALALEITDPPGPGLSPDGLSYLGSAESLVRRGELRVPSAPWRDTDSTVALTRFPPGYSMAIAVATGAGLEPVQSARLVDALAAFVTVFVLVLLVSDATTTLVGLLFGAAMLATPALNLVHVFVLSEPLFLALTALTLSAMVRRPERGLLAGLTAALAVLVRYAGVSLVVAAALWRLRHPGPIRDRVRGALAALAPGLAVQTLWVLRTRRVAPTESIRDFAVYGDFRPTLSQGIGTVASWLVPGPDQFVPSGPHRTLVAALVCVGVLVVALGGARTIARGLGTARSDDASFESSTRLAGRLLAAGSLVVLCYAAVVVASRLLADPEIPFDQRILSPVLLIGTVLVFVVAYHWWRDTRAVLGKIALLVAALAWWSGSALTAYQQARRVRSEGAGYGRDIWRRSDLVEWARTEGRRYPLYSNRSPALYYLVHRTVRNVPLLKEGARMEEFADSVRARGGRVVMFNEPSRWHVTVDSLRRVRGLRPVFVGTSGVVFGPS